MPKKLKNYANAENKELREIGITIKGDGTLELDENKLKAADISQVKKLFTGEDGFAKRCRICQPDRQICKRKGDGTRKIKCAGEQ